MGTHRDPMGSHGEGKEGNEGTTPTVPSLFSPMEYHRMLLYDFVARRSRRKLSAQARHGALLFPLRPSNFDSDALASEFREDLCATLTLTRWPQSFAKTFVPFRMPPKKTVADHKNRPTPKGRVREDVFMLNTAFSWRERDAQREAQLLCTFGPEHNFGVTLLSSVKGLPEQDVDGKRYIDDGASTVETLKVMKTDWLANKENMPATYFEGLDASDDVSKWPSSLVEVFEEGLEILLLEYEDSSQDMRRIYQSQAHDEQNNKFRGTGVLTMLQVGQTALSKAGGKREGALAWLAIYQGVGSKSTAARWVDMALGLADRDGLLIQANLKQNPQIPPRYIMQNQFFVGRGVEAIHRLPPEFAIHALDILRDEIKAKAGCMGFRNSDPDTSREQFMKGHCSFLKMVAAWESLCKKKFGNTARESKGLERVIQKLCTVSGLQLVEACANSKTPFHGTSDTNVGIQECRALWLQFEKIKSGGPAPSVNAAAESPMDPLAAALEIDETLTHHEVGGEYQKSRGLGEEDFRKKLVWGM